MRVGMPTADDASRQGRRLPEDETTQPRMNGKEVKMLSVFGKGLGFIFLVGLTTVGVLSAVFPRGARKVASTAFVLEEDRRSRATDRTAG